MSRGGSRTTVASTMERFVITVNGFITKRSILDVEGVLHPPLMRYV